jgi:hypothetical protein
MPSLAELVHRSHDTVLDALEHSDCPFACVVDALKIARDPSRSPIFQVGLIIEYCVLCSKEVHLPPLPPSLNTHAFNDQRKLFVPEPYL